MADWTADFNLFVQGLMIFGLTMQVLRRKRRNDSSTRQNRTCIKARQHFANLRGNCWGPKKRSAAELRVNYTMIWAKAWHCSPSSSTCSNKSLLRKPLSSRRELPSFPPA